jgi:sulfur relay (sulfurtransferase) DsrC/TusE family protein
MEQIEKDVLQVLYESKGDRPMSTGMIRAALAHNHQIIVKVPEIEYALGNLKRRKLVRSKKSPAIKVKGPDQWDIPAQDMFEIDIPGVDCVKNDYVIQPKEQSYGGHSSVLINNGQLVFGSLTNVEINVFELINELNIDLSTKNEIMDIFNEIQKEVKSDQINKSKVKDLFKRLADKGATKIAEAAVSELIKELFS